VIGQPFFQAALGNSLIVGFGGMLGAMLLGVPLAFLTARYVIVGRDFLATLAVLALVSPPFIGAYAWIMMLGRNGFARLVRGYRGRAAVDLRVLRDPARLQPQVLSVRFSPGVEQPARDQSLDGGGRGRPGRRPWRRFFGVTLPLIFPAVSAGAL
jgi:iron(III) transport system permease protein